ncbi:MAG: sigma-70 family RNA polymerase sigma factor [Actinomycetota bacterium]
MAAPIDDRALVTAAQGGDRAALERLFELHYDRVVAVCRRITGNEADAADAAQEAMIAVVRGLSKFDGRSSFGTWTYRIATNASLDELRRRRRRPLVSIESRDDESPQREPADPGSALPLERIGERDAIESALLELPEEFRIPVVLRDVADLEYADIAQVLDVPIGTVKSRIARGRGMLATLLAPSPGNLNGDSERPSGAP